MVALALSVVLDIVGNVLRAASLFYIEAGLIAEAPPWWHDGIGIAAFIVSAAVTLWLLGRLRDWETVSWIR
jgi:exosortase/archaeosortase family protein